MIEGLVTVIVPVYNAEVYLGKCVNSLLNQSYGNLEIYLINDGSTDASGEIIDRFASMDSRIKVMHQDNQGVSVARNRGLEQAQGEWVAFVDADDFVTEDYIEKLLPLEADVQMSLCGMKRVFPDGSTYNWKLYNDYKKKNVPEFRQMSISEMFTEINSYALTGPVCKLFKTLIIRMEKLFFPINMSFGEDSVFVFSYLLYVQKVQVVDLKLYYYLCNNNSLIKKADSNSRLLAAHRIYDLSLEICDRNRIENIDAIQYHYVDMLLQVIASEKNRMIRNLCYDDIAQLVGTKTIKQLMPFFFPLFAKWRKWDVYEWLTKIIYGEKK